MFEWANIERDLRWFTRCCSCQNTGTLRMLKSLSNTTRESGESVKLRCEVSGDPPPNRFRWYKNEAPVLEEKGRVVVRKYRTGSSIHGSRLRISDVDTHDTGYYKCEASNGKERVESTGIVIVRMGKLILIILYQPLHVLEPQLFLFNKSQARQWVNRVQYHLHPTFSSHPSRLSGEFPSGKLFVLRFRYTNMK